MRALLIVNPHATATSQLRWEVIARALASAADLEVVQTRYRGHAAHFAQAAATGGFGLVVTLGGDGTVNEAANGLLRARSVPQVPAPTIRGADGLAAPGSAAVADGPAAAAAVAAPLRAKDAGPALAVLPGGNANVFARALGLPADPVEAAGRVLRALSAGSSRTVGVGLAGDRYFCFNAGLGLDAEVVRVVEGLRARGQSASTALYVWATARQFFTVTDRRAPALLLERTGMATLEGLFLGMVSNTASWTYAGRRPLKASPQAGFDTGLGLFALRKLSAFGTLNALRQMLTDDGRAPHGKHVVTLHNEAAFSLRARRPIAFQVDGEYVGEREYVAFCAIPNVLRVIA